MLYYKSKRGQLIRLDRLEDLPTGNGLWADDECYIAIDLSIVDSYAAAEMLAEAASVMYEWRMIQEDNHGDRAAIVINAGAIDLINKALDRFYHWSGEAWSFSGDRSLYPVSIIDDDGDSDIIGYSDTLTYPDDWQSLDYRIEATKKLKAPLRKLLENANINITQPRHQGGHTMIEVYPYDRAIIYSYAKKIFKQIKGLKDDILNYFNDDVFVLSISGHNIDGLDETNSLLLFQDSQIYPNY